MLLIWDIHLSAKIKDKVLKQIRTFIDSKKDDNNIVFLWDYVYHFSYDRSALLELFQLFLELYKEWKTVYIISWNHDWLSENFVFEEGKKVFDLLQENSWSIHFITKPELAEIEWEKVLFLPFCLDLKENEYEEYKLWENSLTKTLLESKDKNEVFSWKINQLVNWFIKKEWKLTIIHHYYTNKQKFPWYRSQFSFKDIALSEELFDNPDITLISWHLHAPFVYMNYLCTWSVWPTTSLESNHLKWMFTYSNSNFSFYASQPIHYIETENIWVTNEEQIQSIYRQYTNNIKTIFESSNILKLNEFEVPDLSIKDVSLTLKVKQLDYDKIDDVLDPKLREIITDYRLKKDSQQMKDLIEKLWKPDEEKLQTFWWWQELLKDFLKVHYPDDYNEYENILRELNVI
jgi:hypothetical protein